MAIKWKEGAWGLERHRYAPELNVAHVAKDHDWIRVSLPGVVDLEDAEEALRKGGHIR